MKHFFLSAVLFFGAATLFAQDSASVLFIGNSYTYVNDLPLTLGSLANSLGDVVMYDSQTQGGATLATHAGNAVTYTKINAQPWDFVVLQAQSQEPSFSDSQVDAQTIPYAKQLADSVYANRFCSEVLFFMTWGRENGDPQWAPISTFDGMNGRLRDAYLRMADTVQGAVSPVGVAWKVVRDTYPSINLYTGDGSHPSPAGTYLAACTFYSSIFRKPSVGATYIGGVDAVTAGILQDIASAVVLDSLEQWNLRPIDEHTQALFTTNLSGGDLAVENQSTKAQTYLWNFGDGTTSTLETPAHTYTSSGVYTVTLIASSECDADTMTVQLSVQTSNIGELSDYWKLRTLAEGMYCIESMAAIEALTVMDIQGNAIPQSDMSTGCVDVSMCSKGIYFLKFLLDGQPVVQRIFR